MSSVSKQPYVLSRLDRNLSQYIKLMFCNSLIMRHLNYYSTAYYSRWLPNLLKCDRTTPAFVMLNICGYGISYGYIEYIWSVR